MDYGINDFGNAGYPKRKPWVIVVTVLVVILVFAAFRMRGRDADENPDEADQPPAKEVTADISLPDVSDEADVELATPITSADAKRLLSQAEALESGGEIAEARDLYIDIVRRYSSGGARIAAEKQLGELNMKLIFSPHTMREKITYEVQPGDQLEKIARKFGTTGELIARSNGIKNPNRIKAGDELRVLKGKVSIDVNKARHELVLMLDGNLIKKYGVGLGAFDKTPAGNFIVTFKQVHPTWYQRNGPPVPFGEEANILGTRWMAIKNIEDPKSDRRGLGIHGTWKSESIGKSESAGCIRMRNEDVEQLYALVREGTHVSIAEK